MVRSNQLRDMMVNEMSEVIDPKEARNIMLGLKMIKAHGPLKVDMGICANSNSYSPSHQTYAVLGCLGGIWRGSSQPQFWPISEVDTKSMSHSSNWRWQGPSLDARHALLDFSIAVLEELLKDQP